VLGVNESFAGYLVEGVLGQGGMGTVYLARHPRLPRLVALKLLNRAVSEDEELRRRFEQEANVVARLDHPGIVGIYNRGTQDVHLWISMQYIRGTDAARLDPRTAPPELVLQVITDTAGALDYAHNQGVLHRDIKPSGIAAWTAAVLAFSSACSRPCRASERRSRWQPSRTAPTPHRRPISSSNFLPGHQEPVTTPRMIRPKKPATADSAD
jgi:hypothetical protein